jgi:dTDP-4-dehydrorhamnose reductase
VATSGKSNGEREYFLPRLQPPYDEQSERRPINQYGKSKAAAEDIVMRHKRFLTIRTSWLFGSGRDVLAEAVRAARRGHPFTATEREIGLPTSAEALARAIAWLTMERPNGTIHVAGDGVACSRAELARTVF